MSSYSKPLSKIESIGTFVILLSVFLFSAKDYPGSEALSWMKTKIMINSVQYAFMKMHILHAKLLFNSYVEIWGKLWLLT